jgi:hypothetical protein
MAAVGTGSLGAPSEVGLQAFDLHHPGFHSHHEGVR